MLKRLFGSSEKTKSVRLGVNAYGKLPIYKDFISCGMTDAPAREFRVWLDKGFSHRWSTDEACVGAEIPPSSFLVRLPESRGYAAGSLWGSSDEGGLRKFPFALFLSFPKDHAASDPVAAVEYLSELERRASELRFLFGPGASLSSFYQTYRGTEIDVAVKPRSEVARELKSELSDFSIAEFAESLFGDASSNAWPQLLASAGALADTAGALRVPLSGRLPRARELEFWLLWLERRDPKGKRTPTGILYPHGHNPGRAVIFFRELKPEDFLLLHPLRADLPLVGEAIAGVSGGLEAIASARKKGARGTTTSMNAIPAPPPEPAPVAVVEAAAPIVEVAPMPVETPPVEAAPVEPVPVEPVEPVLIEAARVETPVVDEVLPPRESLTDLVPFPEAETIRETGGGARLSAIIALDPDASGVSAAPVEPADPAPVERAPAAEETAAPSSPAAVAEPVPDPSLPEPPGPPPPAIPPPPEVIPPPPQALPPLPQALPPLPQALPLSPQALPVPPPERVPTPPEWRRPLPSLLEA